MPLNQKTPIDPEEAEFVPEISIQSDPTGPGRDLWCWHFPRGVKEFHGVVRLTPVLVSRQQYIAALFDRCRLTIEPDKVRIPPGEWRLGQMMRAAVAVPPLSVPKANPLSPPPAPVVPKLTAGPKALAISQVIPLAAKLDVGGYLKVNAPEPGSPENYQNNLRTQLKNNKLTKDWEWSVSKIYPHDPGWEATDSERTRKVEKIRLKVVTSVRVYEPHDVKQHEVKQPAPSLIPAQQTISERTEHRVETKTTERSLTVTPIPEAPAPVITPAIAPPAVPALPEPPKSSDGCAPRLDSYLPNDGEDAHKVLDILYKISELDDSDDHGHEKLQDELWSGVVDGIKFYRNAKLITDMILQPWLNHFEEDIFPDEFFGDTWRDLWSRVHGALYQQMANAEKIRSEQVKRERAKQITRTEGDFLELALRFFSSESDLSEADWKRINDKELPALAKRIVEYRK